MTRKPTIQKICSSLLLVLFTISFIPKSYFHDVIAAHTDSVSCKYAVGKTTCVHPQGFHCSFNDLAVTAPYIPVTAAFNILPPYIHSSYTAGYAVSILHQQLFGTESRGPPALG